MLCCAFVNNVRGVLQTTNVQFQSGTCQSPLYLEPGILNGSWVNTESIWLDFPIIRLLEVPYTTIMLGILNYYVGH